MGDSPAHQLPVEIWTSIAITLRDSYPCDGHPYFVYDNTCPTPYCSVGNNCHSVGPLTQTCWYLYNAIQPILFEYIPLDLEPSIRNADKMHSLASALVKRPDLQSAVRALDLSGHDNHDLGSLISAELRHILPQLLQLRYLSVTYAKIDSTITQLLLNATHLHAIRLIHCDWSEDVAQDWAVDGTFGRNLKYLYLSSTYGDSSRRNFQLFVPSLTELAAHRDVPFKYLQISPTVPFGPSLTKLTISGTDLRRDAFKQFVSQCPNIEHLEVDRTMTGVDVSPDFLPKLRHLEDDGHLATVLLPGRPVRSLAACAWPSTFSQPLPNLKELRLKLQDKREGYISVLGLVLKNCRGLVTLSIQCYEKPIENAIKEWISSRPFSEIATLPPLQVLRIKITYRGKSPYVPSPIEYPLSEEMLQEREIVTQMREEHFPDLYEVRMHAEHAWTYAGADHGWVPKKLVVLW